jgi:hypothetical protein
MSFERLMSNDRHLLLETFSNASRPPAFSLFLT